MTLSEVLAGVTVSKMFQTMYGRMVVTHEVEVTGIQYDSRNVERGQMFVAIRGGNNDGHRYIQNAIGNGAKVVVMEDDAALPDSLFMHAGVVKAVVPDARKALALMSANFHKHPSRALQLIGVTGTNGKTTTTSLIKSIIETGGKTAGLIGTIEYRIGEETLPSTHTTPESLELNQLLATMVKKGCSATVMEVSSHALALYRVHGLTFAAATFTNLTQDHLDFHGSMESYFTAKHMLFQSLNESAGAVTNADDSYGRKMIEGTRAQTISYSLGGVADVVAENVHLGVRGTRFDVRYKGTRHQVDSRLIGRFNVQNILAAYATCIVLGIPDEQIIKGIANLSAVRGRFEQIVSPAGWTAVVDYAHTPDALENCLRAIREILPADKDGRIITVFGCGGDRDRGKRPKMGSIASTMSDITIVTSDNPRTEDPEAIIREVLGGVKPGAVIHTEQDRRKAIVKALEMARADDVVLIAGKGHEEYQIIGTTKNRFDDREEVERFIRENG
ncbi:MAG: UDP-N-acetylmuramoyl-L-alanyl-D-glutamate--2,6-diaminopimelate ligase [Bacteroidota bacterium]